MKEYTMNNMWSEKKAVNISINVLLFLLAINIFHYGQLCLPIICLILFVDNKFRLNIKDIKIFLLLCLFAISFFAFSYKLGFYSVMGFCLPMAYYIGSNLKEANEENVKNVIYILAFGMATHLILNFILEICFWYDRIWYLFDKPMHYDIWLFQILKPSDAEWGFKVGLIENVIFKSVRTTGTSMNYLMICSCAYYLLFHEKNEKISFN